jgi:hypothetical protein
VEKEKYNEQMIIQYLLGSLAEDDTERLEELYFLDDEFAARLNAVENDLIDAYVNAKLPGEIAERFDNYYLRSPKRRQKVKTARALHAYAENAVATGQVIINSGQSQTPAKSDWLLSFLSYLPFTFPRLLLTAAALVLLAGIGWLVFERSRLRNQMDQAQATNIALEQHEKMLQEVLAQQRSANSSREKELESLRAERDRLEREATVEREAGRSPAAPTNPNNLPFILAAPTRTAGRVTTINLPPGTDNVVLQVELEPDDFPSYNAYLLSQPGKIPAGWKRARLKSRASGESKIIEIILPATLLKSQEYLLAVTGISDGGTAEGTRGYPFRVVKE